MGCGSPPLRGSLRLRYPERVSKTKHSVHWPRLMQSNATPHRAEGTGTQGTEPLRQPFRRLLRSGRDRLRGGPYTLVHVGSFPLLDGIGKGGRVPRRCIVCPLRLRFSRRSLRAPLVTLACVGGDNGGGTR